MPAVSLSRVGARVVESGPGGGQVLAAGAWQKLEALPDPRSPRGRIYPLACLVAIALCAFTAAGNDRLTAVGQWISRASQSAAGVPATESCMANGSKWKGKSVSEPSNSAVAGVPAGCPGPACAATVLVGSPGRRRSWLAAG